MNYGFWKSLPQCPKKLCVDGEGPYNPDPSQWENPGRPSTPELNLHPGTVWSMRSIFGVYGNQCTYKKAAGGVSELIRSMPGAGTVDYRKPKTLAHFKHDVEPIYLADLLDRGGVGRKIPSLLKITKGNAPISGNIGNFTIMYYDVRPLHAK